MFPTVQELNALKRNSTKKSTEDSFRPSPKNGVIYPWSNPLYSTITPSKSTKASSPKPCSSKTNQNFLN
jgi:hypothetical protein